MFGNKNDSASMGTMPGPAMAAKMMQRMPMMAASMLSGMSGKDKKEFLFETVQEMVAGFSEAMTDKEYKVFIEELASSLKERPSPQEESGTGCC